MRIFYSSAEARAEARLELEASLREMMDAEQAANAKRRLEYKRAMDEKNERDKVSKELKCAKESLTKVRKKSLEAEEVAECKEHMKTYTPAIFGQGKPKAGGQAVQKTRIQALNRIRAVAHLSPEQLNDWDRFTTEWDKQMVDLHGAAWGGLFAEQLQNVLEQLADGNSSAFSQYVHNETMRVLTRVETLRIPGTSARQ